MVRYGSKRSEVDWRAGQKSRIIEEYMKEFLKKYKFEAAAITILLAAGLAAFFLTRQNQSQAPSSESSTSASPAASLPPILKPAPPGVSQQITTLQIVGKPQPGKNYQAVVEEYRDRRIQFDDACRATPNYLTFKNGPEIMLDNRGIGEKVIKLNDIAYKIGPYGFIVLQITAPSLPYQIEIDCNQLFNVASINLQK